MYRQIVVPLDGSTFAEAALPLAQGLSRMTGAGLHLVSVVEPTQASGWAERERASKEWNAYLLGVSKRISRHAGGKVTTAFRIGHVVETLLTEARGREADVVVMATHGRGVLSRAWLGSVTDRFLHQADRPVILIRPEEGEGPPTASADGFETLLVPLDGSEFSECALAHATELGELFDSAYHLTRVVSYPLEIAPLPLPHTVHWMNQDILATKKADSAKYLEAHAERMRRRGLRVTTSVPLDPQPGNGILAEAEAVGCDAIAMATHGRTGVSRAILGSAADKVLRGTHVPLLLYRPAPSRSMNTNKTRQVSS